MKEFKSHIIDVVPLTRIPLTRNQSFCYLAEKKIAPGSLVSVPLFHRQIEGIVLNSRQDFKRLGNIYPHTNFENPKFKEANNFKKIKLLTLGNVSNVIGVGVNLKKIDKTIEETFLTDKQLELAQFISDYYVSPLGIVMKNFVPTRTKPRKIKKIEIQNCNVQVRKLEPADKIILTGEQQAAVDEITKKVNWKLEIGNWKFLLYGPASSGKTEVYIHSILKIKKRNPASQFLILVPEKTLTPQALERYGVYFKPEEISILSSNISKGQYYSTWQKIKSGEAKIIIGTRMAVFAPFQKLGLIVIDEEQDISYKQWDMNPRYDARMVAEKLAEMHNCPLVRGSATPSVESYFKAIHNRYKLLKLPKLNIQNTNYQIPSTILVDMKKERWTGNYSCISKTLKAEIAYALKNNQQIILFINRQGMSAFSVCENCKTVLRCPNCDRALIYHNSGIYKCSHCSHTTSPFPQCSSCRNLSFKNIGLGTQKVEKEIEMLFPGIKIIRADRETSSKKDAHRKIFNDFSQNKASILIGTQMISKGWDLPRVALIGIIDADNLFSIPDFFTNERAIQHITQISGRTSRFGSIFPGKVVIQTFHPENKNLQLIVKNDLENFYKDELAERSQLKIPPFGKMLKLIFQDRSLKNASAETQRVYNILQNIPGINVAEPQDGFIPKIRGRFRKFIIIKCKNELPNLLRKELKKMGSGWIIDIDPISIL